MTEVDSPRFAVGLRPGASRVVIYIRYIPRARLGLLQGFRVTYVATWREKTIFEDISSSPVASVESDERLSFTAQMATDIAARTNIEIALQRLS